MVPAGFLLSGNGDDPAAAQDDEIGGVTKEHENTLPPAEFPADKGRDHRQQADDQAHGQIKARGLGPDGKRSP